MTIVWCFDVLDKCIIAKVEEERTKTITLKYTTSNGNKRGVEVRSNHLCMKSRVEAFNKKTDVVWNMVIFKNFINQSVMNLTKCVL